MRGLDNGTIRRHDDCSEAILARIIDGFRSSPAAKPFSVEFLDEAD